jgi:aspartate/methionine/tyrosine aminotransferase
MPVLPDFRLETYFSRWEFTARYNAAASDMETWSVGELLELAGPERRAELESIRLGYIETFGSPALRAAIARTYQTLAPEDVICFAGAEEGLYCAMHALLEPADHAVVLVPNYQSMEEVPRSVCAVTGVALDPDAGWALDLDRVRAALRPNTRVIAVNFPNNPTGRVIPAPDFDALIELARSHGIYLFSDEVYRGLERNPALALPQAADRYERGLSLGVMSKAYGLAGLRVGWIASRDRALLERLERLKHYLSICNAGPSEWLAVTALQARGRILARNRALVHRNLELLGRFFGERNELFEWELPDGGCVGYPRYRGPGDVEEFCRGAVEQEGVLLLPASIYRSSLAPTPDDRFRVGYGRKNLPEALDALARHCERLR